MSQHQTRNNTNRRSRRSGSRVGDSSASNGKRFRRGKGGEFDDLSTLSSKERKKKAANRKQKDRALFNEEENGLGVAMRDQGGGGEVPAMPSLRMNSGQNITPEQNNDEGNGGESEIERYHTRKGHGYDSDSESGGDNSGDNGRDSDDNTSLSSRNGRHEYGQGNGTDDLEERGKDLFSAHDEGMSMTMDGEEDLFINDRNSSKSYYCVQDLNQSMKRKPKSVGEVYSDNIQLRDREANLLQLRKAVRTKCFPSTKFIGDIEKFQCTKEGVEETSIQKAIFRELGMRNSKYKDIDRAIMWNTYSKEVASLMSQCRSSVMCEMKKVLVPEIYRYNKGGAYADNSKIKDLIMLCCKENDDDAEEDSLRMQSLLETHNEPGTHEWKVQFCLYKQFIEFCVLNVVGKSRMKKMGENYADGVRETYEDAIKPTDEGFAMLCLEDRWRLWAKIAEKRAEEGGNDGTRSLENKDEDDQRERGDDNKVEPGTANLSKYSMYGIYNTQGKGFVPNRSMARLSEYRKKIKAFRETENGKKMNDEIRDWWGKKYKGPKMKMKRVVDDITLGTDDEGDDFDDADF